MDRLLGIGISVPGMVDASTHSVLLAPNLGWEDVDLGTMLKSKLGLPVYIENEAMASAICENWIGACQEASNFVCVNIKSGIGAGIFTGGRLYRGTAAVPARSDILLWTRRVPDVAVVIMAVLRLLLPLAESLKGPGEW